MGNQVAGKHSIDTLPRKTGTLVPFQGIHSQSPVLSYINGDRMVDSFVEMAKIDTASSEAPEKQAMIPSTESQREFAAVLKKKLAAIGLQDVSIDAHAVVMGTLPSNIKPTHQKIPVVGLLAHMDTSSAVPSNNIQPVIHRGYRGGDLRLPHGPVIPAGDLAGHIGETIITSNGRTLLGADDKAGIAEILEILQVYKAHPELQRPHIKVAFTPDEEIGRALSFFNIDKFGVDAAYTIDGSMPGELESECFNAHGVTVTFIGKNIHAGHAKGKMVNTLRAMAEFIVRMPMDAAPETTAERQGFIHPMTISQGTVGQSVLTLIVRDFDATQSQEKIKQIQDTAKEVERIWPGCSIQVDITERYRNMREFIDKKPEVLEYAREGIRNTGLKVIENPIRGGTDGAGLSARGLPTPNLAAGEQNLHALTEFVTKEDMQKCAAVIINTMTAWADAYQNKKPWQPTKYT